MVDRVGQHLGNYRILRELGRGGFADVFLGEHIYLKSHAALKVLHTTLAEKDVARFLSEAQTLVRLRHSHIVRVLEFAVEQGAPVLVMDYAPGGTLRHRYPRGSQVPLATVAAHIKQIAAALSYAHSCNVIHRDVKPENLLLGEQQELLLSDFGLALLAPSSEALSTQEMAGTLPYMAPEQIRGKPGFASDQYALGIMAYEWLCGRRPFEGTSWEILRQHLDEAPPRLREWNPALPEEIEAVVLRALAKDPQQRFVSVQAFAHAFQHANRGSSRDQNSQIISPLLKGDETASATFQSDNSGLDSYVPVGVFLAAASADEAFAARLKADLEARRRGMFIWNGRLAGTKYAADQEEGLRQEIRAARLLVVVLSPRARSSRSLKKQLQIAAMYQRELLLLWKAGDEWAGLLPEGWQSPTILDLIDASEGQYEPALDEIISYLEASSGWQNETRLQLPEAGGTGRRFSSLPVPPTPLVGRERERAAVAGLLQRPEVRLVTLTGPGGIGKTRLGLQVATEMADQFADGVCFVALAPLSDPELVVSTIAQALGVKEIAAQSPLDVLKASLQAKQLLLLLDNFEQVVSAAVQVADLLAACPRLKVVVTSRMALRIQVEREFVVPPLTVPNLKRLPDLVSLLQYEAVALFNERAQAAKADFAVTSNNAPTVAAICARLDGQR